MTGPVGGKWERLDESPLASAQMIQWHAPETYRLIVTAALTEAADAIEAEVKQDGFLMTPNHRRGFSDAARIVRAQIPPP